MTEVGVVAGRDDFSDKFCSCGKVRPNYQIKVADLITGKPVGVKEEGEVCVKTPYCMLGYYKNPESTKEAIDADGKYHENFQMTIQ